MDAKPTAREPLGSDPSAPVDLLVVGGGPCGTAAAFRATELGRSVLVIDRDAPLGILAEWIESSKPEVEADYTRPTIPFPTGGELIRRLEFGAIAKTQDLLDGWLAAYHDGGVPFRSGAELVDLEQGADGVFLARILEDRRSRDVIHARHVLLAIGRSVNPSLDILGDTDGIRFRLGKATNFVGKPACVIGGGLSAAEAVIAIAQAKSDAKDEHPVYWVNRKKDIRRIAQSEKLQPEFFAAWTTGVIRYLPSSRPLSIIADDSGNEVLAVRVQRREARFEAPEITCYEFEKPFVLACIGSNRNDELLDRVRVSVYSLPNDTKGKTLVAVTPLYESERPGLFVGGSLLHPEHLVVEKPGERPVTIRPSRTQFKLAMEHGVRIADTVDRLLAGESRASILRGRDGVPVPPDDGAPAGPTSPITPPRVDIPRVRFTLRTADGTPVGEREIGIDPRSEQTVCVIGSGPAADWTLPASPRLRPEHGRIVLSAGDCYVESAGPNCHVFVRFRSARLLPVGTRLQVGDQRLLVAMRDGEMVLHHLDRSGRHRSEIPVGSEEVRIGRGELDPGDSFVSRAHLRASRIGSEMRIVDTSSNGTFVEVDDPVLVNPGDRVWMGEQFFEFDGFVGPDGAAPAGEPQPPVEPSAVAPTDAGVGATIEIAGRQLPMTTRSLPEPFHGDPCVARIATLAGLALQSDEVDAATTARPLLYDCWKPRKEFDGPNNGQRCGMCAVRIEPGPGAVVGARSAEELRVLQTESCDVWPHLADLADDESCRLACQLKVQAGIVRIHPASELDGS